MRTMLAIIPLMPAMVCDGNLHMQQGQMLNSIPSVMDRGKRKRSRWSICKKFWKKVGKSQWEILYWVDHGKNKRD